MLPRLGGFCLFSRAREEIEREWNNRAGKKRRGKGIFIRLWSLSSLFARERRGDFPSVVVEE